MVDRGLPEHARCEDRLTIEKNPSQKALPRKGLLSRPRSARYGSAEVRNDSIDLHQ
jgi:hypothetical protein